LGDWTLPHRHHRQPGRSASQPVYGGRPARPLLVAGPHLQPSASLLCRPPQQLASADRARADHLAEHNPFRVREPDGICVRELERVALTDTIGPADAHADRRPHTHPFPHTHAYTHPDTDANAHPHSDTYANPDAHAHTDADAHAHPDTDAHPDADAHAHPDADAHPHPDTDANPIRHHERI
jgi:hypothetical protein